MTTLVCSSTPLAPATNISRTKASCWIVWRSLLAQEKVVGWFQGRMEYGPRALGCRSIIGDARSPEMQQTMNLKIKFRESFRPFAPCVLRECVDTVFVTRPDEDSPYMLFVAPVRDGLAHTPRPRRLGADAGS